MFKRIVLATLIAVSVQGGAHAGGDPMYGGLESSPGWAPERSHAPVMFRNPFGPDSTGQRPPPMARRPPPRRPTTITSPRLAMHWYRLDANGRLQLETYLRQWLNALTAEQQQAVLAHIQQRWAMMPPVQQAFLGAVFQTTTTDATSAAASPLSTDATALTTPVYDPTLTPITGAVPAVDPLTGVASSPVTTPTTY